MESDQIGIPSTGCNNSDDPRPGIRISPTKSSCGKLCSDSLVRETLALSDMCSSRCWIQADPQPSISGRCREMYLTTASGPGPAMAQRRGLPVQGRSPGIWATRRPRSWRRCPLKEQATERRWGGRDRRLQP